VQKVLYLINEILKAKMKNIRYTFNVISPLAEGADRLIVKEVMEWQMLENEDTSSLEVVLPFSKDDYIRDFETDKSKDEFEVLLRRALSICTLEKATSREAAYENVGHYIVDNSDFLIAIWNGESAVGKYPIETICIMRKIIESTENSLDYDDMLRRCSKVSTQDIATVISHSVVDAADMLCTKAIVASTISGYTARKVSSYRPCCPIIATTPRKETATSLSLNWGVIPVVVNTFKNTDEIIKNAIEIAKDSLIKR
jgi:hypothetical protein